MRASASSAASASIAAAVVLEQVGQRLRRRARSAWRQAPPSPPRVTARSLSFSAVITASPTRSSIGLVRAARCAKTRPMTRRAARRSAGSDAPMIAARSGPRRAAARADRARRLRPPARRTRRAPRAPTRGLSSRAAVASAVSTSSGTGRRPARTGRPRTRPRPAILLRTSTTRPTRLRRDDLLGQEDVQLRRDRLELDVVVGIGDERAPAESPPSGYAASFSSCTARSRVPASGLARSAIVCSKVTCGGDGCGRPGRTAGATARQRERAIFDHDPRPHRMAQSLTSPARGVRMRPSLRPGPAAGSARCATPRPAPPARACRSRRRGRRLRRLPARGR